jgi:MFS family permease
MWWVCLSGVTVNMASYATNTFFNAFLQRYYGANAMDAGWIAAGVLGLTGLLAMTLGAYLTDLAQQHTLGGRLKLGAYSMLAAGPLVAAALCLSPQNNISAFVLLYGGGWTLFFMYYVSVYTVVQDVVVPHLRATAMAVYFAAQYLIGSSLGTTVVGGLSDYFAKREMVIAGASSMTDVFKGQGLHWAMFLVPLMLIISSGVLFMALRTYRKDHIDPT